MTMDEMVTEILRLHEACKGAPSTELVHIHAGKTSTVARIAGHEAEAPGIAAAVSALRDKLRAEAAAAASEHEARASVLRAALGERDPSQTLDDARVAWREYTAARNALVKAQLTDPADIPAAQERLRCAEVAMDDLLVGAP